MHRRRLLLVAAGGLAATTAVRAQGITLPQGIDRENALVIETAHGPIVMRLRNDLAPAHAERLKVLARRGFYDNVPFHRVIPGFMAQTGDGQRGNGTGGSDLPNLRAEFSREPFRRGTVGMARTSDPNSANAQFFIGFADAPHLNGQYTVVGQVVSGMEAVDRLATGEPPRTPDRMIRVRVAADIR
jgi:peptidylprolyl isomerase